MFLNFLAQSVKVPSNTIDVPKVSAGNSTFDIIVNTAFIAIGGWAVLFLVIGGIRYIISNGDQAQIQKAKNTVLYAAVGLVVALLGFTIVQFILGRLL